MRRDGFWLLYERRETGTFAVLDREEINARDLYLLLEGIELHGVKQKRMVNVTVIIGKRSEAPISVSCVEKGRWNYRSDRFASSRHTVASKLRNRKGHVIAETLVRMKRTTGDQRLVWRRFHLVNLGACC